MNNRDVVRVAVGVLVAEILFTAIRMTPREPVLAWIAATLALVVVAGFVWRYRHHPYTGRRARAWSAAVVAASVLCALIR
jgi:predicted aspartyl protease